MKCGWKPPPAPRRSRGFDYEQAGARGTTDSARSHGTDRFHPGTPRTQLSETPEYARTGFRLVTGRDRTLFARYERWLAMPFEDMGFGHQRHAPFCGNIRWHTASISLTDFLARQPWACSD